MRTGRQMSKNRCTVVDLLGEKSSAKREKKEKKRRKMQRINSRKQNSNRQGRRTSNTTYVTKPTLPTPHVSTEKGKARSLLGPLWEGKRRLVDTFQHFGNAEKSLAFEQCFNGCRPRMHQEQAGTQYGRKSPRAISTLFDAGATEHRSIAWILQEKSRRNWFAGTWFAGTWFASGCSFFWQIALALFSWASRGLGSGLVANDDRTYPCRESRNRFRLRQQRTSIHEVHIC